uniref:Peptidase A1 domain-containing protein n=1 Tax=Ditylenchus dipsaci TaxID=166011 RepID=A0A915ENR3_9BILA
MASTQKVSIKPDMGNAMLLDYVDDYYLVNISLGTPPQWLLVQPSMFSSDFWVIDSECDDDVCLGADHFNRHLFNKSLSRTFYSTDEDVTAPYEFDASIVSDILTIGGLSAKQNFALAYELEEWFYEEPMDGILGLGSYPGTFKNVPPVMQTLKESMDDPVFTIFIQREDDPSDIGGQLTFGAQDSENCENDWSYTMVNNHTFMSAYWEFQVNGFTIQNATKTTDNRRRRPAIIMLDFPFIAGPAGNIQTIAESLGFTINPNYGVWVAPCSKVAKLPDLQLKIGDGMINLKASQFTKKYNTGKGFICYLTLMPFENQGNGPAWYFGDSFLRSYCVSFEIGNGNGSQSAKKALQVGFSKTKPKADDDDD